MTGIELVHQVDVVCGLVEASCRCVEAPDHDGPHVCECGGSWGEVDGEFEYVTDPGSNWGYVW